MKQVFLFIVAVVALASSAAAQSLVPDTGLVAVGDGRWNDALAIYRQRVEREPGAADTWLRIADIEVRLSQVDRATVALQRAAAARPYDPRIFARLSQAYAATGHAQAALHAIKGALALQPDAEPYLRAAATLATWAGDYATAADAYGSLRRQHPQEHALLLALARVNSWSGRSDAAAAAYREYVRVDGTAQAAWLELARVESWRGNTAAASAALDEYRTRFQADDDYARERAMVLARGGRPREALRHLEPLLAVAPHDPALLAAKTIALAGADRHGAAASTLERLRSGSSPDETHVAGSVVRSLLGTSLGPSATVYDDSDGLRITRVAPTADFGLYTDTRIFGGYAQTELDARTGSGLDAASGSGTASIHEVWSGISQRIGAVRLGGTVGQARIDDADLTTYAARVQFAATDSFKAMAERSYGFAPFSPRAVSLHLTRLNHRGHIEWAPDARYQLVVEASYDNLSDANTRWELFVSPRAALVRTQRLNLDAGVQVYQFRVKHDVDHGYYDPRRYELYSAVLAPYWKASENIGVSLSGGLGPQRDDTTTRFTLGMNAGFEATFGIYRGWVLKAHGSATNNRRVDSGAFRGTSGGVALLRRF